MDGILVKPIGTKILVEADSSPEYFMGSFRVPDTVGIAPQQGRVIGMGNKVTKVKHGTRVLFGHGSGEGFEVEDVAYLILDEKDVICELTG